MIKEIIKNNLFEAGVDSEIIEFIMHNQTIYLEYDLDNEYDSMILNNKLLAIVELVNRNSGNDLIAKELYEIVEKKINKILNTKY